MLSRSSVLIFWDDVDLSLLVIVLHFGVAFIDAKWTSTIVNVWVYRTGHCGSAQMAACPKETLSSLFLVLYA